MVIFCIEEGCRIRAIYNNEGETRGMYCFTHKKDNMVDIINKLCIHPGCKKRPTYNIKGEKKSYVLFYS
jgi:hypothetical protein